MTRPSPERGGYAWTEWLAREMENNPMPHHTPTETGQQATPVHRAPIGSSGFTPCCDKSPLELPTSHRITEDNPRVTCSPAPTVVYHWTSRLLPQPPVDYSRGEVPDFLPRPDPDDSYECGLRDVHNDGEHHGIGWVDLVDPATDRERWEWKPYYRISYPDTANIKPLRVCEDCASYLTSLAEYLLPEAEAAKVTDRIAFDTPIASALDALYYLAIFQDPSTLDRLTPELDALDEHGRVQLATHTLEKIFTPLTAARTVILGCLLHINGTEYDTQLHTIHTLATALRDGTGDPHELLTAVERLNHLISVTPRATTDHANRLTPMQQLDRLIGNTTGLGPKPYDY